MMQIKHLLFTIFTFLSCATQFHSNAMLISKTTSFKPLHQHMAKLCNKIAPYNRERDEKVVTKITSKHLPKLMSDVTHYNKDKMLQDVMNTINDGTTISKVYLVNDQPIGFINYYINQPLILAQNLTIKSNAHINFLAIDDEHHGKGAGTALLNNALNDLEKRSIHTVTLRTTAWTLEKYYYKFGFTIVYSSKYTGCTKFIKRLQPHPMKLISSALYKRFLKNKE